jgi:hypothetical protein
MANPTMRFSENFTIEIGAVIAAVAAGSTLDSQHSGTDVTDDVKEVNITGGERDLATQKLIGYNEARELKRATVISIEFKLVGGQDITNWESYAYGTAQAVTGNYYRVQGGEKSANDRSAKGILFKWSDGTNHIAYLFNNAYAVTPSWSLAADGSLDQAMVFKCLASDFYYEDDFT